MSKTIIQRNNRDLIRCLERFKNNNHENEVYIHNVSIKMHHDVIYIPRIDDLDILEITLIKAKAYCSKTTRISVNLPPISEDSWKMKDLLFVVRFFSETGYDVSDIKESGDIITVECHIKPFDKYHFSNN